MEIYKNSKRKISLEGRIEKLETRMSFIEHGKPYSSNTTMEFQKSKQLNANHSINYLKDESYDDLSIDEISNWSISIPKNSTDRLNELKKKIEINEQRALTVSKKNIDIENLIKENVDSIKSLENKYQSITKQINLLKEKTDKLYLNYQNLEQRNIKLNAFRTNENQNLVTVNRIRSASKSSSFSNYYDQNFEFMRKKLQDYLKTNFNNIQQKFDEDIQSCFVKLQLLESALHDQETKLKIGKFDFQNLCSKVIEALSEKFDSSDSQALVHYNGHTHQIINKLEIASQMDLVEKYEILEQNMKGELKYINQKYINNQEKYTEFMTKTKESLKIFDVRLFEENLYLKNVLTAEIKSRRDQNIKILKAIRDIDQKYLNLSNRWQPVLDGLQFKQFSMNQKLRNFKNVNENEIFDQFENYLGNLSSIWNHKFSDTINEFHDLKENFEKNCRSQKDLEYKYLELSDKLSILHKEIIILQTRDYSPKHSMMKSNDYFPDSQPISFLQSTDKDKVQNMDESMIRKLAESILAVKISLTMRIRKLEGQLHELSHQSFNNNCSKPTPNNVSELPYHSI